MIAERLNDNTDSTDSRTADAIWSVIVTNT